MKVMDAVNEARASMRAGEVFGTPIEKNGLTVIPAAKISGGGGGGTGTGKEGEGGGMGFGLSSQPAGAFVIKGNEVTWRPAVDVNRIIFMGQVVAVVALLTIRTVVKALAKR